jgi:hypothetical protein
MWSGQCSFAGKALFVTFDFCPVPQKTVLGIYDRSEVFIVIDPEEGLFDSPALWSNNQSLISAIQDYFEMLWLTAMEDPKL